MYETMDSYEKIITKSPGSQSKMPSKISRYCTIEQLRDEALHRGLDIGTVPLPKTVLMQILGDGSASSLAVARKKQWEQVVIVSENDNKSTPSMNGGLEKTGGETKSRRNSTATTQTHEKHSDATPDGKTRKNARKANTQEEVRTPRKRQKTTETNTNNTPKIRSGKSPNKGSAKNQNERDTTPTLNGKSNTNNSRKVDTQLEVETGLIRQNTNTETNKTNTPKKQPRKSPKRDSAKKQSNTKDRKTTAKGKSSKIAGKPDTQIEAIARRTRQKTNTETNASHTPKEQPIKSPKRDSAKKQSNVNDSNKTPNGKSKKNARKLDTQLGVGSHGTRQNNDANDTPSKHSRKSLNRDAKTPTNEKETSPTLTGKSRKKVRKSNTPIEAGSPRKRQKTTETNSNDIPEKQSIKTPNQDQKGKYEKRNKPSSVEATESQKQTQTTRNVARANHSTTTITTTTTTPTAPAITTNAITNYLPRIHKNMSVEELKEEARARNLYLAQIPKNKSGLLCHLVVGSIHVAKSEEYKQYLALLGRVNAENASLTYQQQEQEAITKKQERQQKNMEKEKQVHDENRKNEMLSQLVLHTNLFPQVHPHALAFTSQLKQHGRSRITACIICRRPKSAYYTCEQCDWDLCRGCFEYENMSPDDEQLMILSSMMQKKGKSQKRRKRSSSKQREKQKKVSPNKT